MLQIVNKVSEWRELLKSTDFTGKSIGFVPTMGALHEGHLSLIRKCRSENDLTVVSIFVNPTQFNDKNDFKNYPVTYEKDLQKLVDEKADYLFYPDTKEIYNDDFKYEVTEKELSNILCGAHRPGHFTGVLTVVMKLLNIIRANHAYFGEKDYQQYKLINGMTEAFFIETKIIPCPIVREQDGLAMSSRNVRLSETERKQAARFPELLKSNNSAAEIKEKLESEGFIVDYIEELDNRRLGAVHIGKVRLIDNVEI